MLNRKFLEELELEKGIVDKILDAKSEDIGALKKEAETAQNDLKIASQTVESLKKDLKSRDEQLETLKTSNVNVEDLKTQIESLQADNASKDEAHNKEINDLKKDFAINEALRDVKAKNLTAVKALLKTEGLEMQEDGTIKGLSEQLETLLSADDTKFLFDSESKEKQMLGAVPGETGNEQTDTKVDYSKMSYEEIAKHMEESKN